MDVSDQRQVTELLAQLAAISAVLRAIANSPHALQPIRHDPWPSHPPLSSGAWIVDAVRAERLSHGGEFFIAPK